MNSRPLLQPLSRRRFLARSAAAAAAMGATRGMAAGDSARGIVFHDRDGSGRPGPANPGLPGVAVSNGRDIVLTDGQGRWHLPLAGDAHSTDFFVIPRTGWTTPVSQEGIRRAHFTCHPAGSPALRFPGFAPQPLPESVDFPLLEQVQPDRFNVLVCGDPQPRDLREIDFLGRSVPQELAREEAAFAVALGDIVFDDLAIYPALRGALGAAGKPWHYVIGNHDLNFDSPDHAGSRETFRSQFGPTTYAFDCGPVHFIVLDNVEWLGAAAGGYRGMIRDRDLAFIENDLAMQPAGRLVVVFMHIPLFNPLHPGDRNHTLNRDKLFALLARHPQTLSFSAHTHWHHHVLIGAGDGWPGARPHHHVISGTLCGSWFRGAPDACGIPHATMADGTPRGYQMVAFDGNRYEIDGYRVLGGDKRRQLHIHLAGEVPSAALAATQVHVNLYSAGPAALVRARVGGGPWRELARVGEPDPHFAALAGRDAGLEPPLLPLPRAMPCPHLWSCALPAGLPPGNHLLEIEADDGFGHARREVRPFRVLG
jgi:hypothetical protein